MGALGTVTGLLDVWILDVLLKPSVSKLWVGPSSFGGGSGKGFIVGEAFALPAGFPGVPFGFEDPIVWDHIAQAYGKNIAACAIYRLLSLRRVYLSPETRFCCCGSLVLGRSLHS